MAIFDQEMDQCIADSVATYPHNIKMACEIASLLLKDQRINVSGKQCYARYNYFVRYNYICFEFAGSVNTKNDYRGREKLENKRNLRSRRTKGRRIR